jgi:protein-S-isoprenylcysteine O-methyltransferase Ste14
MESAGEDKDHAHVVAPPPVIFGIVLVAGWLLNMRYPLGIMNDPGALFKTIGNLLFVISGVIMVSTTLLMASKKTALRPDRKTTTIVTSGFFRYSRNPLYLSLVLIFLGIALHGNSLWLLILLPVLLLALERGVILHEERYLARVFGREYLQYKDNVRRWI